MKHLLLSNALQADFDLPNHPEKTPQFWAAFMAYVQGIKESGIVLTNADKSGRLLDYFPTPHGVTPTPLAETLVVQFSRKRTPETKPQIT